MGQLLLLFPVTLVGVFSNVITVRKHYKKEINYYE